MMTAELMVSKHLATIGQVLRSGQVLHWSSLQRNLWVALNRARTKVGRTGDNMKKWGCADNSKCQCGTAVHTMQHLMQCPCGPTCIDEDLRDATDAARTWLTWWRDKI